MQTQNLQNLNSAERHALGQLLIDSAQSDDQGFALSAEQERELLKRVQAHQKNQQTSIAHERLMETLQAKLHLAQA